MKHPVLFIVLVFFSTYAKSTLDNNQIYSFLLQCSNDDKLKDLSEKVKNKAPKNYLKKWQEYQLLALNNYKEALYSNLSQKLITERLNCYLSLVHHGAVLKRTFAKV